MSKELFVYREPSTENETHGEFIFQDQHICYSLEDIDRDLCNSMSVKEILSKKVYGQTAIPYGRYELKWYDSPKFGRTLQIVNVKGFSYILIHAGNTHKQTSGCILTGTSRTETGVADSKDALAKLRRLIYTHNIKYINVLKRK